MAKLAVIPSDPLEAYKMKGIGSRLKDYYNPLHFFDEVYLFSPLEQVERYEYGMHIIPTKPKQLKKYLKDSRIDLVRAYGGYWACDMACQNKVKGIPVVVSVHDTNPNLLHQSIKKADIILCVSEAVRKLVLTKIKEPDKVWLLPNRVDLNVMRPYPITELTHLDIKYPFKHKILHVGRKSKEKNLDTVIKALKILGEEYCLLAIGRGNPEPFKDLAKEYGVQHQCYFIESIENEELACYYSWSDCLCNPSRWEGFGVVFIEALACETVIVTSDIPPMNEYLKHKVNGLLVRDYENPQALAKMIKIASKDMELRKVIKGNARKSVEMFEKSKIDQWEVNYYKKILELKYSGAFNRPWWKDISFLKW